MKTEVCTIFQLQVELRFVPTLRMLMWKPRYFKDMAPAVGAVLGCGALCARSGTYM